MTINDKLISAVYFSTSGGHTEDVENVWTNPLPYLRGVEDKYEPPTKPWVVTYTKDEFSHVSISLDEDLKQKPMSGYYKKLAENFKRHIDDNSEWKNEFDFVINIIKTVGEKCYIVDNLRKEYKFNDKIVIDFIYKESLWI